MKTKTTNNLQKSLSNHLKEKTLDECQKMEINPNKSYPGFLPNLDISKVDKWAERCLLTALK